MNNELTVLTKEFEGNGVGIIIENGELLFELYSTGMALGQIVKAKGKIYPNKARIEKNVKNAEISTVLRNAKLYLNEEMLYDLMLEMKTDKVKPFRKWITSEVLPSIRQNGGYIDKGVTEEQVDKLSKYSLPKLKNTFKTENIEHIKGMYSEVKDFYKFKSRDTDFRLKMMNNIEKGLNERIDTYQENKQIALITLCDEVIKLIKDDKDKLRQKVSGGQKSHKTKLINKLQPKNEEYMVLDCHGISENYMFETIKDSWSNNNIVVKTKVYENWIKYFPTYQLKDKEELKINWDKSITVFLKFDCMDKFDVQNLQKSIIDQVITKVYKEDDNVVSKVVIEKNKSVETYKQGKIYICIKNS